MALGALCAFLVPAGRSPIQANAQAAAESDGAILPLVQFENAPLVDVIKTLARQANLNVIIDPQVTAADQTGKSVYAPVSIRLENVTALNVLEAVLNNNNLRLERDPTTKVSRVAFNDPTPEGRDIESSTPEAVGKPKYEADGKTCVLKVKLEPNKTYAYWLNSEKFKNFKDQQKHSAVPYLLVFQTKDK